jgi:hypothetical protein
MKKNLPKNTPEVATVRDIPGTKYVLLPDGRVAKPLKPMTAHGTTYYNLFIDSEYTRLSVEKIGGLVDGTLTVEQLKD